MEGVLGTLVAVEGDGIAVHLVLYLGEHFEEFAFHIESDCLCGPPEQQFVGAVAVVFGQSRNGYIEFQFSFHHLSHHIHLPLAAIGDDEVGEGRLLFCHADVAPPHHLLH